MAFRLFTALGMSAALALGCSTSLEEFRCESNADCVSEGGLGATCEPTQLCSFADPTCPEGQRYGSAAGSSSNTCVGEDDGNAAPDAGSTADADPLVVDGSMPPIDAADSCVAITIGVFDDALANDKMQVIEDGMQIEECQPDASAGQEDTMAFCMVCVAPGATVRLKMESVSRLSVFQSDCNMSCGIQEVCAFTASVACSAYAVFDPAVPPS
jgi:hypothetical protein